MGVFYLLTSLLSYFGLTLIGPIGNYMNRNVHKWKSEGSIVENFIKYNTYLLFVALLSIPIVYASTTYLGILSNLETTHLISIVSIGIYFTTLNTFFAPTLNLFNYRISFVVFSNLTLLFNIIFSIALITVFEKSGLWWFTGQIVSQTLFTILSGWYFFSKIKEDNSKGSILDFNKEKLRSVLSFSLPLALATFFLWATNESYRFIIERFLTLEYLGFLAVGIAVSTKISTAVETLLHQLFHPTFFEAINTTDKEERRSAWNSFFNTSLPSYISVTIFISCLSPFLLRLLSGSEFYGAWVFLVFGAILNLVRMITNHVALIAHTEYNTRSLILPGLISAISSVTLVQFSVFHEDYYYLIPTALVIGSGFGMVAMIYQMNKILRIEFQLKEILLSLAFGLNYFGSLALYKPNPSLIYSTLVILGFGLYFIITQLFFFKKSKSWANSVSK